MEICKKSVQSRCEGLITLASKIYTRCLPLVSLIFQCKTAIKRSEEGSVTVEKNGVTILFPKDEP